MLTEALSRVLIVDDEPDIRLVVRLGLEASGLSVAAASNAAEAIAAVGGFAPQLILLDVEMPGVDGVALLELLRGAASGSPVVVAFLTARADAEAVAALRRLDVVDVLVKPIDPLRLGALVRELWGRRPGCP